ncbi:glucosaminidase domain-containing protein [Paucilactobacillus wasatchensis]|uniref:N-acetylmuramoyl-L-alanine amidase n=1 Tax=Paucilactobacillus wasatchensis TaxID=1335616 RepID=A0A0D1A6L0_9LACO|nr:glucosaminidase domain-containing protein [Paucilactobacillus wasatchensis]KIS03342.1 N-acetylmuramoyl-L-alanine amidase [Paucilactobacillus wasatchensis]
MLKITDNKILSKFMIIILVTALGLNWLTTPILAAAVPDESSEVELALKDVETNFLKQTWLSKEQLSQKSAQYQATYDQRLQVLKTEFDCGREAGQKIFEQHLDPQTILAKKQENQFYTLGLKVGYQAAKDDAEKVNHEITNHKKMDEEDQKQLDAEKIPAKAELPQAKQRFLPDSQNCDVAPNLMHPLPRGVATIGHQRFIEQFGQTAQVIAFEHNLYASVMIAQAVLESSWGASELSSAPNYNLFGIKGVFAGEGVLMKTNEDNGHGKLYQITGQFRHYPSYAASLNDYANIMLRPVFARAWRSNTASYKDATAALTGTYATDTAYGAKLNQIIETYDLTKYDQVPGKQPTGHTTSQKAEQQHVPTKHKLKQIKQNHAVKASALDNWSFLGWLGLGVSGWWLKKRI